MFGANFGYNFQSGQFVYGVEVSGAWTSLHGDYEKFGWRFDGRVQSYETLTGRFGFLSGEDGSALYYARGGVVWGQYRYTSDWPEISTFFEADKTLTGAAYGIGWERSLWNNWTIKAEYMRYDFGSTTIDLTPNRAGVAPYRVDVGRFAIDSLNIGLNYRFETAPPAR
jgi:outer membrane immunogenic protein